MEKDIYVLVSELDGFPDGRPIVWEQYIDDASLDAVKELRTRLNPRYGRTRIAKLVFVEEEGEMK